MMAAILFKVRTNLVPRFPNYHRQWKPLSFRLS